MKKLLCLLIIAMQTSVFAQMASSADTKVSKFALKAECWLVQLSILKKYPIIFSRNRDFTRQNRINFSILPYILM